MLRTITVTWTETEELTFEVPEGLTQNQIDELVRVKLKDYENNDDLDYEWNGGEPIGIEMHRIPPNESWVEIGGYKIAVNRFGAITDKCPDKLNNFHRAVPWHTSPDENIERYFSIILGNVEKAVCPHHGYFLREYLKFFLEVPEFKILRPASSNDLEIGYMFIDRVLVGLIMPVQMRDDGLMVDEERYWYLEESCDV